MTVLDELGVRPVINATGYWTKVGNATPSQRVRDAMDAASSSFIPFAELQAIGSSLIARITGSEAGYVTPGGAAALTLGVAACIAGEDADRIKSLPAVSEPPHTVVLFQQHLGYYDFALRATGARLRTIDAFAANALEQLGAALTKDVACLFFDYTGLPYKDPAGIPDLPDVISVAHSKGVRVIVDASLALPPHTNLQAIVRMGADAVAFSGSKAIQGPPASGLLACRSDMIRSIALQHQDLNVWAEIKGAIDPQNLFMGIGRTMKIGKEQIVGLLVALEDYAQRDHDRDQTIWRNRLDVIEHSLADIPGVSLKRELSNEGRAPYLMLGFDGPLASLTTKEVSEQLLEGNPRVFMAPYRGNVLLIGPEGLRDDQPKVVARKLLEIIGKAKSGPEASPFVAAYELK